IRRSGRSTINSARIGTSQAVFNHRQNGELNPVAALLNGAATAAVGSRSNSVEPASAISSRHFLAPAGGAPHSADLADAPQRRNVARVLKPIFLLRSRERWLDRRGRFRCAEPVRTKWKRTRLKSRAACMKVSAFVSPVRVKP